ncbi:MAG TPA: DUF929 family protein [Acidimicrobiales bacterium]|nr:DUF929 family protein [Acidimicrobiales bacterium]
MAIVVVVVLVVVIISVTGSKAPKSGNQGYPPVTPANPAVVQTLATVPASTIDAVGTGGNAVAGEVFTVKKDQPPLKIDGKPGAIFVGGLFCPLCGADRWAMVQAFSRFGTFTGLQQTTSSPVDSDPSTVTFDFTHATYSSPYIAFSPVERFGNDTYSQQVRTINEPLTAQEAHSYAKYGTVGSVPYFNIGNKVFAQSAMYDPGLLTGNTWSQVAAALSNPKNPITQAIIGSANYITAGICATNGQQPANVCSASGVKAAATAMGLS